MENGRIAIPSMETGGLDGQRSGHFGHCDVFTLVDVVDGEIKSVTTVPNQGHVQGGCIIPVNLLAGHQVNAVYQASGVSRPEWADAVTGPRPFDRLGREGLHVRSELPVLLTTDGDSWVGLRGSGAATGRVAPPTGPNPARIQGLWARE